MSEELSPLRPISSPIPFNADQTLKQYVQSFDKETLSSIILENLPLLRTSIAEKYRELNDPSPAPLFVEEENFVDTTINLGALEITKEKRENKQSFVAKVDH